MLHSMTGFSSLAARLPSPKGDELMLTIELKTLNSRFFEVSSRLPSSLSILETDLASRLKRTLLRGRVFLTIQVSSESGRLESITPSVETARSYYDGLVSIQKELKLPGEVRLQDLTVFSDIFVTEKAAITDEMKKALYAAIEEAAKVVMTVRLREGGELARDIASRFEVCKGSIEEIDVIHDKLIVAQKERILAASQKADAGDEEAKVLLEDLYNTLNKLDVAEEITRFRSHREAAVAVLENKNIEKGKRLDFLLQELLREINTIAAKCSNYEISQRAVDVKVELEKAREQVQNVL